MNWLCRFLCATGLVAAGFLAVACGGSSPGVASLGTTPTTAASAPPGTGLPPKAQAALAFSQCMHSHGVANFPTPVVNGGHVGITITPAVANSPQFQSATAQCRHLLPAGGVAPTITSADVADYLKGVACMRSHGFPNFPDPTISQNQVNFEVPSSIDANSPRFKQAVETCERLIPAGLPYSDNRAP